MRIINTSGQFMAGTLTAAPTPTPPSTPTPTQLPTRSPAPTTRSTVTPTPPAETYGSFTIVRGTETFKIGDGGTLSTTNGMMNGRDLPVVSVDTTNDPRVNGTATGPWNVDFSVMASGLPQAGIDWGTRRLENEDGAWEGPFLGAVFPGPRDEITFWLKGSGAYEGLTYYMHIGAIAAPGADAAVYPIEGIIFKGSPPAP